LFTAKPALSLGDAIGLVYASFNRAKPYLTPGADREIRHPEWTGRLLRRLGSPDQDGYNVAVTGSKGKGSHAILLAAILEKFGFRTGLFTGPHLVDFMERFRINGQSIHDARFVDYIQKVYAESESFSLPQHEYIGPVGLLAAVASLWFRDERTDVNVYELGRGALHDDVNQVVHRGAVMAPVFPEHVTELGPTWAHVAPQNFGIIGEPSWAISAVQSSPVLDTLAEHCRQAGSRLRVAGRDFDYTSMVELDESDASVVFQSGKERYTLRLPAGSTMTSSNAAVAFDAALQVLSDLRPGVHPPREIDLRSLMLPGRMQVVRQQPLTLLDGTIHAQSAAYVREWASDLKEKGNVRKIGMIVGIPADKSGTGVLQEMSTVVDWVIVTRAHNPYLHFDGGLTAAARNYFPTVLETDSIEESLTLAQSRLTRDDALCIVGTQSVVGDTLKVLGCPTRSIWRDR